MNSIKFLFGEYAEKRKYLRTGADYVYADNDDVEGVIRVQGKDYFFISRHPFADFTALQYVSYCRSLVNFAPMGKDEFKRISKCLGVKIKAGKKLKRLNTLQSRLLSLLANYKPATQLRINLDGYAYSRRRRNALRKALIKLAQHNEVAVSASDTRFVFKGAASQYIKAGFVFTAVAKRKAVTVSKHKVLKAIKKQSRAGAVDLPKSREFVQVSV